MKEKLIQNYLYSLIYQLLTVLVPLITTPYISRILTSSEIGLYDYSLTICTYFTFIASAGIPILAQREVILHEKDLSKYFSYYFFLRLGLACLVCIIYCGIVFLFPNNRLIFWAQGIGLFATGFDISWYYAGRENFKSITNRNIVFKIISLTILFTFVKGSHALIAYTLSITIPNLIGNLLLFFKLGVRITKPQFAFTSVMTTIKEAVVLLIPSLVLQLYAIVDKTILGSFSTLSELGYYAQAFKIVNVLTLASTTLGTVIFPQMVRMHSESKEKMCSLTSKSMDVVLHLFLLPTFGIAACSDIFSEWFYGNNYIGIDHLLVLAMPIVIFKALNYVTANQAMIATNREKDLIIVICVGTVLNCVLDILLTKPFGAMGAICATAISELIILIVSIILFKNHEGNIELFKSDNTRAMIAAMIEYAGIVIIKRFLLRRIESIILLTLILGGFGTGLYIISLKFLKDSYYFSAKKIISSYIVKGKK